jgi:hypothetical protein
LVIGETDGGRAKNSARLRVRFFLQAIRAGFEPWFYTRGNINGSKPARFNPARNEYHQRAEFFAARLSMPKSYRFETSYRPFFVQKKARDKSPGIHT